MENDYYTAEFVKHSHNMKQTWHTIKSILKMKAHDALIKLISVNGAEITESGTIAEKFNNYFTCIAQDLVDKILASCKPFTTYLSPPKLGSFAVDPTTPEELLALTRSLKCTHSCALDDINPCIVNPLLHLIATPLAAVIKLLTEFWHSARSLENGQGGTNSQAGPQR